jgi:hypothetical protein
MAAYWVDILAAGFFALDWTVYAVTPEIVTRCRRFASSAWRAMGS